MTTQELIDGIENSDDAVRAEAWQQAGEVGAPAIGPLAGLVAGTELEVGRAAKRAMWKIVRHAGRPGADDERKAVVAALLTVLGDDGTPLLKREVMWMLSEIAGDEAVGPVAALLGAPNVREDARMTLERIPGERSLAALNTALAGATEDFKPNLAQSLRRRGEEVPGVPCAKLVPTKSASIERATTK